MRVIDDDDKTLDTIVEFLRSRGCIGELVSAGDVHNADKLAELLRAEVMEWWSEIDPENPATWLDCWAYALGERDRVLIVSVDDEGVFHSSDGRGYLDALPFVKV